VIRRAASLRPPRSLPARSARGRSLARADGAPDGVELRPLPPCERTLEPTRVPGLDRNRTAVPARAPAGLGGTDLLAPGTDVGHRSDPPQRTRRLGLVPDRDVRADRRPPPRAGGRLPPHLRARRPRPRDAGADVSSLRVFFIGGLLSYRALFNWIRPWIYIPTMLGAPLFQILFFTYLGRYSRAASDDAFFIVGNAVQVCGMSCVYGMTMAVANERWFGTLGPLLASPANRVAVFLGRGVPVFANGFLVSAFGFAVGAVLLDFRPAAGSLPALFLVVCL